MTMPLAYRRATYAPVPAWRRWWPLAVQEAALLFRSRWGQAVVFLCLLPALVRLVMLMIIFGVVQFGPPQLRALTQGRPRVTGALNPLVTDFYVEPVLMPFPGMLFALVLSALVPARAIARDRATNALELYWTRGISPFAYLLAKWIGSALMLAVITVAAPFVLWVVAVFLNEDWSLLTGTWLPMLRGLGGLGVATLVWSALAILVSAACTSANAAMVLWTMLLLGSTAAGVVASEALRDDSLMAVFSVWEAGATIARGIAGLAQRRPPIGGCCIVLGTLLLLLGLRARKYLRVTEAMQ